MKHFKIFLLLGFLLQGSFLFSQQSIIPVQLNWTAPVSSALPDGNIYSALHFDGAIYVDSYGNNPVFYQRFVETEHSKLHFEIINQVFVPLNDQEISLVSNQEIASTIISYTDSEIERNERYTGFYLLPLNKCSETGKYTKLVSFDLIITRKPEYNNTKTASSFSYPSNSVFADGNWFKISVENDGIYQLTYEDLSAMGMDMNSIDPQNIRLFGNGGYMLPEDNARARFSDPQEVAITVHDGADGSFDPGDYILFYGSGTVKWDFVPLKLAYEPTVNLYSNQTYYFITSDKGSGKRIPVIPSTSLEPNLTVRSFIDFKNFQPREFSLAKTGKDWYGVNFTDIYEQEFSFSFPNVDTTLIATLTSHAAAKSGSGSRFTYFVNGDSVMYVSIAPLPPGSNLILANASSKNTRFGLQGSSPINVKVVYSKPLDDAKGWLNYITLNVMRKMIFSGPQMSFRNFYAEGSGTITQYEMLAAHAGIRIWDITDHQNIREMETELQQDQLSFRIPTDSILTFIAFENSGYLKPVFVEKVENQNLHALGNCDMIIVSPEEFTDQAERIKSHHETQDMISSIIVSPDQIYNEFSSGKQDPAAIRDFTRMIYLRTDPPQLKYVLLMGDGSYDPLNRLPGNNNFIPSYQSTESLKLTSSFASDDFYGLMDEGEGVNATGTLDLGVGRFPVKTHEEAKIMVDKIINYADEQKNTPGTWRTWICLTADDEDNNLHFYQADTILAKLVNQEYPSINLKKVYLDSYKQITVSGGNRYPEVNEAINKNIAEGVLIMNYTGHGGELGWAYENVVTIQDVLGWKNLKTLPVFITATCEFTRYDNPAVVSAGELVVINPHGGGVALFSTTRLAFAQDNIVMNKRIYQKMFKPVEGSYPRLGDLIKASKTPSSSNMRNFTLFGDPAMMMAFPKISVVTSQINGKNVGLVMDTLSAGQIVNIKGYISDPNGQVQSDYNGTLFPSIFDKARTFTTQGNDPTSQPVAFDLQNDILYNGQVSIVNGEFDFSFMVPKDISYQYGLGRISYYAHSSQGEAVGYFRDIVIGGIDDDASSDQTGPIVKMYLNDSTFINGQKVNLNPILYIHLADESGINYSGNGIGHDITLIIDENESEMLNLNKNFTPLKDSYQEGNIELNLSELSVGQHQLSFKVWDNMNNSSQVTLEFEISNTLDVELTDVNTVPNPFSVNTEFRFRHNHFNENLDVDINIYSIDGQLVHSLSKQSVISNGYWIEPIQWDGKTTKGNKLNPGVYIYDILVSSPQSISSIRSQKLIVGW